MGVGMAVMFGMAVGAEASTVSTADNYSCEFSGQGTVDPPVESLYTDATKQFLPDLLDEDPAAGLGSYQLEGDATCVFTDGGVDSSHPTDEPGASGTYLMHVSSGGSWKNRICGTGFLDGNATITATSKLAPLLPPTKDDADGPLYVEFHIDFYATHGVMHILYASNPYGTGIDTGEGYVNILPKGLPPGSSGGDCVMTDVQAFAVNGAFDAAVPDVAVQP
jgi:hypothetical protein